MKRQQQQQNVTEQEQVRNSARMLIVLENGEQRLITFNLPKESCTVQELLEQIGVPLEPDTNIHCVTSPGLNIDYLVTVGVNLTESPTQIILAAENLLQNSPQTMQVQQQQQAMQQNQTNKNQQNTVTPKYIQGCFALCAFCGYSSNNHAQCQRCHRIFAEEPKRIPIPTTVANQPKKTTPSANKILNLIEKQNEEKMKMLLQKRYQSEGMKMTPRRMPAQHGNAGNTRKKKVEETVILTLSSDEEDDE